MKKKTLTLVLSLLLVALVAVGGTLAWLKTQSAEVVNTFTYGDINISLTETTGTEYKMIPGNNIKKDPIVTVNPDSEACWLFVEIEKNAVYDTYLEAYGVREPWQKLSETGNVAVYYTQLTAKEAKDGKSFYVLNAGDGDFANGYVKVKDSVEKSHMEALKAEGSTKPTLKFVAYAVQSDNFTTPDAAWAVAK